MKGKGKSLRIKKEVVSSQGGKIMPDQVQVQVRGSVPETIRIGNGSEELDKKNKSNGNESYDVSAKMRVVVRLDKFQRPVVVLEKQSATKQGSFHRAFYNQEAWERLKLMIDEVDQCVRDVQVKKMEDDDPNVTTRDMTYGFPGCQERIIIQRFKGKIYVGLATVNTGENGGRKMFVLSLTLEEWCDLTCEEMTMKIDRALEIVLPMTPSKRLEDKTNKKNKKKQIKTNNSTVFQEMEEDEDYDDEEDDFQIMLYSWKLVQGMSRKAKNSSPSQELIKKLKASGSCLLQSRPCSGSGGCQVLLKASRKFLSEEEAVADARTKQEELKQTSDTWQMDVGGNIHLVMLYEELDAPWLCEILSYVVSMELRSIVQRYMSAACPGCAVRDPSQKHHADGGCLGDVMSAKPEYVEAAWQSLDENVSNIAHLMNAMTRELPMRPAVGLELDSRVDFYDLVSVEDVERGYNELRQSSWVILGTSVPDYMDALISKKRKDMDSCGRWPFMGNMFGGPSVSPAVKRFLSLKRSVSEMEVNKSFEPDCKRKKLDEDIMMESPASPPPEDRGDDQDCGLIIID